MKKELSLKLHSVLDFLKCITFKSQVFHWNVQGINFLELHKFFEKIYRFTFESEDVVAENIRKLGYKVNSNLIVNSLLSTKDDIENATTYLDMLRSLRVCLSDFRKVLKETITISCKRNRKAIENDLAEILGKVQKFIWMLKQLEK